MSLFHVETTKTTIIDGVEYSADIKKDIVINFSDTNYTVKMWEDTHDAEIELVPDDMGFLHELTAVFPLSDYDIKIIQSIYRHTKPYVSLHFDIRNKKSGEKIYFADGAVLSDKDYDYVREVLIKGVPQYEWHTAENYLRSSIERCMGDDQNCDLFTDDAWNLLSRMVSARYRDFKTDGYIDFDFDLMQDVAKEILEETLRSFYELQDSKDVFSVKSPEWGDKLTTIEDLTADELEQLEQNIKQIKEKNNG